MSHFHIPSEETLNREGIARLQSKKLHHLLQTILPANLFYKAKLGNIPPTTPLAQLPFTTRPELEADQLAHPIYGSNLTFPLSSYCRFHQTSGTGGRPLRWLDTPDSWAWFEKIWAIIFSAAGIEKSETIFFPFSFGPFVGFWGAFSGATRRGNLAIPAGGMTTTARLKLLLDTSASVVCCTPTYALHLAEVAAKENLNLQKSKVRAFIVAGEPGGSIPEIRNRIESAWNARVFDHTGMTEIGALGFECLHKPNEGGGVHLAENECIAEVINPATAELISPDQHGIEAGELVLTNLGRLGSPLLRYRTGDLVRISRSLCLCGRYFARMQGGILGRADDLVIIRGNNVFPSAIDALLRSFPEIAEYQVEVSKAGALTELKFRIEPAGEVAPPTLVDRVTRKLHDSLNLRCPVQLTPPNSLPRFELKARRWLRKDK